ncbi:MAG: Nramp family divalent metal transporter [Bdellovibrionaceae bacterium]|nr:Nramp family divalent metal transporter [Pseudobdellovibrionaceae bacterium]
MAAAVAGSKFGYALAWAAAAGALLKYVINEGLARWQLATGTTLLEGWVRHLGSWVRYFFLTYLVLWSFIVGGALISACGLAGHTLFPQFSVKTWGIVHSALGIAFVYAGSYQQFEKLMKFFIGLMFVFLVGCALFVNPPLATAISLVREAGIPAGSQNMLLGVIGGVGGSLTLLVYGYWMQEKKWEGKKYLSAIRVDLGLAYFLTGLFGVAVIVLADHTLFAKGITVKGTDSVIQMAQTLEVFLGRLGYWTFVLGFWGAVATSLLGVWQSVPYLFCDFIGISRNLNASARQEILHTHSRWYRAYLFYLGVAPLVLLWADKPVLIIVVYSIVGALFMPFLVLTLLYLNSRRSLVGELSNKWWETALLLAGLALFAYLCFDGIREAFVKIG